MVFRLALAELTEGMAPLVYATGFSMAYYGFNGTLLRNVKSNYWGGKTVDDIGYLFQMMLFNLLIIQVNSDMDEVTINSAGTYKIEFTVLMQSTDQKLFRTEIFKVFSKTHIRPRLPPILYYCSLYSRDNTTYR